MAGEHHTRDAGRCARRRRVLGALPLAVLGAPPALAACTRDAPAQPQQTRAASAASPAATTLAPSATAALPIPVLPENTLSAFRLVGAAARDARLEVVPAAGQPFAQALRVRTLARPPETFHIQVTAKTAAPVDREDVLLATFHVRGLESQAETGEARTTIIFEQASEPYSKSLQLSVDAGPEWRRIDMPFKSLDRFAAGQAQVNFQVGFDPQAIEIGGVALANYQRSVAIQDLPRTRFTYAGREVDAAWRTGAAQRIEALRKADLLVVVRDAGGIPVAGADVVVRQRRHAFGFGSAVAAAQITSQGTDGDKYRDTISRLFSRVVMENDLKWPNWEDASQRDRTLRALQWLHEQGIPIRGHNLIWPSWRYLPGDVQSLRTDPAALRRRSADHIADEAGALQGQLIDWDVINEPHGNHDLMDVLGQDAMVEWFRLARQEDPTARLFLNEATTPASGERQDALERNARFLIDQGAPLDGVGIQCHYGWSVTPPDMLLRGLDRFAQLDKLIEITEFDVDVTDEDLQADYTRDLLAAAFSHPAVDAVLTWGFWEGRHWRPDAALFRRNWQVKPNGQAWSELVTKTWWTNVQGRTDRDGAFGVRGFLGEYEIVVGHNDSTKTAQASHSRPGTTIDVVLDPVPSPNGASA